MMTRCDFIKYFAALAIVPGSLKLLAREPRPVEPSLDGVLVFNRSLSSAEVQAIFEKYFDYSPTLEDLKKFCELVMI